MSEPTSIGPSVEPTEQERKQFFRSLTSYYIRDYTHIKSTPERPFRFAKIMVMEADEHSWYKELVGTEQMVYLHCFTQENGTIEIDLYCAYEQKKKDRILITGKFKKEHIELL